MDPADPSPETGRRRSRLARLPSLMLLTAGDEALATEPPQRFARSWIGLMVVSVLWGLLNVALWDGVSRSIASSSGLPLLPAAAVLMAAALVLCRRGLLALGGFIAGREGASLAAMLIALLWLVCLLDLPGPVPGYSPMLPPQWQWLRPLPWYRVLLLAPLWGGWSMLIVAQFCRPCGQTEPAVAAMVRGCGPAAAALSMAIPLAATLWYFNHLSWWQPTISMAVVAAATVGGLLLCRRAGRLDRSVLLAVNVLTQIVFVMAYLVNRSLPMGKP